MKKKVVFFLPGSVGGAERITITIAKMLPKDLFEVQFVIVDKVKGDISNFIPLNCNIQFVKIRNIWDFTIFKLVRILKTIKPDIAFCSLMYLNSRVIVASKICGVKVVVRNNIGFNSSTSVTQLLVKFTYKWADKVIAQQDEMRDEIITYTKIPCNKVLTIPNPLDTTYIDDCIKVKSPYGFQNDKQYKYVWVARFSYEKGHDILVKAFFEVRKTINNAHLYLVGKYDTSQSFYNDIKQYVDLKGIKDCVHFIGFDKNPYRWIKYADCYVMPSRLEGLPNSLVEAMYIGKPVVATKCVPVVSRIVKDGYNGILAETENIQSLAKSMIEAIELRDFKMTYHPSTKHDFIELLKTL